MKTNIRTITRTAVLFLLLINFQLVAQMTPHNLLGLQSGSAAEAVAHSKNNSEFEIERLDNGRFHIKNMLNN